MLWEVLLNNALTDEVLSIFVKPLGKIRPVYEYERQEFWRSHWEVSLELREPSGQG